MQIKPHLLAISFLTLGLTACGNNSKSIPLLEQPPIVTETTPESIELAKLSAYETGIFGQSAAEIPAYDARSKKLFVVNAEQGVLDVIDLTDPKQPTKITSIIVDEIQTDAEVNSVAVYPGIVAIAIQAANKTDPGFVALYRTSDLSKITHVTVGALPDMLTFTPDGKYLLVANEGEPSDNYQIDPEGSVSIIDVTNLNQINPNKVRVADFKHFNGLEHHLRQQGVRIYGPNATAAQDFEPEYISVTADGKLAWVALQENNALAKVDIATAKVLAVYPLGYKDHGAIGHEIDVSDSDGKINITTWSNVRGLYMPDAISSYDVAGTTYIVSANEGDARAWGEDNPEYFKGDLNQGFVEEWRVKHLVHKDGFERRLGDDLPAHLAKIAKGAELNPQNFMYCGATEGNAGACRNDEQLGRLNITWTEGYQKDANGHAKLNERGHLVYDHLYSYGARSFSIWKENSQQTGLELVWDSGSAFEQTVKHKFPHNFNSNHEESNQGENRAFDNRSDNKGPEPEGITLGKIGDKTFAFIGLERMSGIMVYDVSEPTQPKFIQYFNDRNFKQDHVLKDLTGELILVEGQQQWIEKADLGPEGLSFIAAKDSPNAKPLLIVGNEVSGTTAVYEIKLIE